MEIFWLLPLLYLQLLFTTLLMFVYHPLPPLLLICRALLRLGPIIVVFSKSWHAFLLCLFLLQLPFRSFCRKFLKLIDSWFLYVVLIIGLR